MMKVGLVYHPIYLEHDTGQHVENADRLQTTMRLLGNSGLRETLDMLVPEPASVEDLTTVHTSSHVLRVEKTAAAGGGWLDADTVLSPRSYDAALFAAGGVMMATDAVITGTVDSAFVLVRPPGHHATQNTAMGFCLFNNVAIAARRALSKHGLDRVLIVDFDVHHGNGTQDAFYDDPRVMYFSTHQYPLYPGTGRADETGAGQGLGTTVNIPLPPWSGDDEHLRAFEEILVPMSHRFQPQIILVSAGYDAHWADYISSQQMTVNGYARIVTILKQLSADLCQQKLVLALEGGYHLQALAYSIEATLDVLLGSPVVEDLLGQPDPSRRTPDVSLLLQQVKALHGLG
jgi:acetoin utilization deacetylase AcuC-like enzyme